MQDSAELTEIFWFSRRKPSFNVFNYMLIIESFSEIFFDIQSPLNQPVMLMKLLFLSIENLNDDK